MPWEDIRIKRDVARNLADNMQRIHRNNGLSGVPQIVVDKHDEADYWQRELDQARRNGND